METKNATIRLPKDLVDVLTKDGDSINQAIISTIKELQQIRIISMHELKGIFSANEWKFLADSLNGTMVTDSFRYDKKSLIIHCEDSELYDHTAQKYNVNIDELKQKINTLKGANIESLYRRVSDFWEHPETDIEKWAKY